MDKVYIYMIRCNNGALYTGVTNDIDRRFDEHSSGRGARYTAMNGVDYLAYVEEADNRSLAMKRERQIKNMWKSDKEELVKQYENRNKCSR